MIVKPRYDYQRLVRKVVTEAFVHADPNSVPDWFVFNSCCETLAAGAALVIGLTPSAFHNWPAHMSCYTWESNPYEYIGVNE